MSSARPCAHKLAPLAAHWLNRKQTGKVSPAFWTRQIPARQYVVFREKRNGLAVGACRRLLLRRLASAAHRIACPAHLRSPPFFAEAGRPRLAAPPASIASTARSQMKADPAQYAAGRSLSLRSPQPQVPDRSQRASEGRARRGQREPSARCSSTEPYRSSWIHQPR